MACDTTLADKIIQKVLEDAKDKRADAGHQGSHTDGGAGALEMQVRFYQYGYSLRVGPLQEATGPGVRGVCPSEKEVRMKTRFPTSPPRHFANGKLVPRKLWSIYDAAVRYLYKSGSSRAIVSINGKNIHVRDSDITYDIVRKMGGTFYGVIVCISF